MDLSTEELLSRKETLKQFENYIDETSNTLKCLVEKIGWTLDKTPVNDKLVKCPFNNEHKMPPSTFEVHCQKCRLKKNGYDSTHSLYPSYNLSTPLTHTVKIDEITQMRILKTAYEESNSTLNINLEPREVSQSIERYICDFTPDERRVLYDSAVKYTKLPNHKNVINDLTGVDVYNKTDDKPKTEFEILREQRDLKRKSAAYRGKKVHTDRKSYVEVLREVIEGLTNNLAHSDDKSVCDQTSNTVTEITPTDHFVYKCVGNLDYGGNPYTRWLTIETEESKFLESQSSYQEASTSRIYCKDQTGFKKSRESKSKSRERKMSISELKSRSSRSWSRTVCKSRKSRSKSRERKRSTNELKSKRSRRSRSSSVCKETKYKKPKIRSKSKEYVSVESKHKRSRKRKTRSKSKESESRRHRSRSISLDNTDKRSKKHRTRSESKELEKIKCSKSLTSYIKLLNEKDSTLLFKPGNTHKKKKHKSKKSRSKSPRRSYQNNKNNFIENIDDKISNDNDVMHPVLKFVG